MKSYVQYSIDPNDLSFFRIEQLLPDKKTKNGTSIKYHLNTISGFKDTMMSISFYNKGVPAPLQLTIYSSKKGRIGHLNEYDGLKSIEPWRDALFIIHTEGIKASLKLYYLKNQDTVFTDHYFFGRRINRIINNKGLFDVIYKSTQTAGAKLFYSNCTSCHHPYKDATGPKLTGVTDRRSEHWLRKWISNPGKMLAERDPTAWEIYNKWHRTSMTSFRLSSAEMDQLIIFLKTL